MTFNQRMLIKGAATVFEAMAQLYAIFDAKDEAIKWLTALTPAESVRKYLTKMYCRTLLPIHRAAKYISRVRSVAGRQKKAGEG